MHLNINLSQHIDESYPISLVNSQNEIIKNIKSLPYKRYAVITDSNVRNLYKNSPFFSVGKVFHFEAGEKNKNIKTVLSICDKMQKEGFGRDSAIIAVGGGVVGDMAGFAASIYMRGIDYIQIPTTMLAMADSSVGGKTGVDTKHGKNLLGSFKQPIAVYILPNFCKTLNDFEYLNGIAESIKHGIIADQTLFDYLASNKNLVLGRKIDTIGYLAMSNCQIKASVVEKDPYEKGIRRILNYGHTIGHAVEHLSKYKLSHGQAVSIGMATEGYIGFLLGLFKSEELKKQNRLLSSYGLPITVPNSINPEEIIKVMRMDKKSKGNIPRFSLPCMIGRMCEFNGEWAGFIDEDIILSALNNDKKD
jgi:3-dehydroquinate synthase